MLVCISRSASITSVESCQVLSRNLFRRLHTCTPCHAGKQTMDLEIVTMIVSRYLHAPLARAFEIPRDKNDICIEKTLTYTFSGAAHRTSNYRCGREHLQHEERGKWLDFKAWHCRERWQASGRSISNSPVSNYLDMWKIPCTRCSILRFFLLFFGQEVTGIRLLGLAQSSEFPSIAYCSRLFASVGCFITYFLSDHILEIDHSQLTYGCWCLGRLFLKLVEQPVEGVCKTECKTIERTCQEVWTSC